MSVVAAYKYRGGERVEAINLAEPGSTIVGDGEFGGVRIVDPAEQELRVLQERFNLHPLAIEDALKAHQQPKLEIYGEQLFIVATTARFQDDAIVYGETAIFVGDK